MFIYRSNRIETLFEAMARILEEPLSDPFEQECVVVPSRGLATWLGMQLAERFGIWAGGDFPFPRRFVHGALEAVLGSSNTDAFTSQRLLWPILAELPGLLTRDAFSELAQFVTQGSSGRNLFQLAQRIAQVFDQYTVFRPDMLLAWESGREDDWQAELWRTLVGRLGRHHPAALARDFVQRLSSGEPTPGLLPSRVCVFGVTTLPPMYLQLLSTLDQRSTVHLFVVSPSREYWAEMRSHREALRALEHQAAMPWEEDAPLLLASLGTVGRDFQIILESSVDYQEHGPELYVDPGVGQSMLHTLQSDLLNFRHREEDMVISIGPDDASIAIHACHSPMREVEVLHDQLLEQFASDPTLQAQDVVVMMSDVETYAPLVEAVFERDPQSPTYIPYCVADRSLRSDSPTIEALHRILSLVGTRVTASAVLDLLALEPIAARCGIAAEDVDTLTAWVTESGIRWGIDAHHRGKHGQPEIDENTWRFGLNRLLLGYAMPGSGTQTFRGVLPFDELEGQQTQLLGQLSELCETVFAAAVELASPRSLVQWQRDLSALIEKTLAGPERNAWELQKVRSAIDTLVTEAQQSEFDGELELDAVLTLLSERIEDDREHRSFLSGGVTFCAMLPMRSVPFKVVCMLGLSDAQFPRRSPTVSFDWMLRTSRAGDRSRRTDDRYLFLEAVLAARERLWLFYVGQSIQDNSELPPSVVLSDFVDALAETFAPPGHTTRSPSALRQYLTVRHPMQPFSPRYFGADPDPRLFSYEANYVEGARALLDEGLRLEAAPLLPNPLPTVEFEAGAELQLTHLIRFFRQPSAELLKRRLGIYLDEWNRDRSDREPMALTDLERWRVGTTLLQYQLDGQPSEQTFALLRAGGALPLGVVGRCGFEDLSDAVDPLACEARAARQGSKLPDLHIDIAMRRNRLVGTLGSRWTGGVCTVRFSRIHGKHLLAQWIQHLALCIAKPDDQELATILIGRGEKGQGAEVLRFGGIDEPRRHLDDLIDLYWRGQQEPLLLFPKTSWEFCQRFCQSQDYDDALRNARRVWSDRGRGERDDPHIMRLFGERDVLDPKFSPHHRPEEDLNFVSLSIRVFGPLFGALQSPERPQTLKRSGRGKN